MVDYMTIQKILLTISIIMSLIFTILIMLNIRYRKIKFIKNHIISSLVLTIPSLVLAFINLFIDGSGDLEEIFIKVVAFAVPIMLFCVVIAFNSYINIKSLSKKIDELEKDINN